MMTFDEVLARVLELLQRQGWVSYRTLKRRFGLDENTIAALKAEIIEVRQLAVDEQGTRLVWTGTLVPAPASTREREPAPPVSSAMPQPDASAVPPAGDSSRRLTPLVGREQEVALLLERWAQVQTGQGQVVVLSGEAGIGKSRLVQELKEHVAQEPHVRWECRCAPYYQHSAWYPVMDLFQRALRFEPGDGPQEKLHKLEEALSPYDISLPETVPLFAFLLSVPLDDRYPPLTLTPERQKRKTLEAVLSVVGAVGAQQGVLMIVEDLQWVDPSTLELLTLLVEQAPTVRLYLVLTYRPGFRAPWARPSHLTSLTLSRLLPAQVEAVAQKVAGGKGLPPEVCQQLVAKTEGVPLFVEELTKMVLELGLLQERENHYELAGPLPPLAIPSTLHDSLLARLEGLGEAKVVAQAGAVWGRGFTEGQLRAVVPLDIRRLERALGRLVAAGIFQEVSLPPRVTYIFKHALIQEAAYGSMPLEMRQEVHKQVAQVLVERFTETVETQPELLAHHYTEAGLSLQAIPYWQQAGKRASDRAAHAEAIKHLTTALDLLAGLPEDTTRDQLELGLQVLLGLSLASSRGYAAPEVEQTYHRARELCQRLGESTDLFPVLRGLCTFYMVRGDQTTARELAEQCLRLAQDSQKVDYLIEGYRALGYSLCYSGELEASRALLEQGLTLYESHRGIPHTFFTTEDPGVASLALLSFVLWLLGYPDQALRCSQDAFTLAQKLEQPFNVVYAHIYGAGLHQLRREPVEAAEHAHTAIEISTEHGLGLWLCAGTMSRGIAKGMFDEAKGEIKSLTHALAEYRAGGAELMRSYYLAGLAETHRAAGQQDAALATIAEALEHAEHYSERVYDAALYHLRGELTLAQSADAQDKAETDFLQAIDIARSQRAKSLELRAAISLSRLWQQQGKKEEARQLLAEVYDWFTEGFDTKDLQEARALLAGL